jgi:hypothetical protein
MTRIPTNDRSSFVPAAWRKLYRLLRCHSILMDKRDRWKNIAILVAITLLIFVATATAQDIQGSMFSFDTGYSVSTSSNTQLRATVGEAAVGNMRGSSFAIGSGFLVDSLVGTLLPEYFTLSGTVHYGTSGGFPIGGVSVTLAALSHGSQSTSTSDNSGTYQFGTLTPGNYLLTASKVGGFPVDYVNAADALKVLLYSIGATTLTSIQQTAADVNNDGVVNAADALQILLRYIGSMTSFPRGDWVFVLANSSFTAGTVAMIDNITALAAGDVNMDALPSSGAFFSKADGAKQSVVALTGPAIRINNADVIEVPIRVKSATSFGSISLAFQHPAASATFVDVSGPEGMVSAAKDGVVKVAWFNADHALGLKENDAVITLRFKPRSNFKNFSVTLDPNSQVTDAKGIVLSGVGLEIPAIDVSLPTAFALGQNYPNPFNPNTTISYQLPLATRVSLNIYNTLGQLVANLVDERKEPGYYQAKWNANVAGGVYFYRLKTGDFVDTKKMILLK